MKGESRKVFDHASVSGRRGRVSVPRRSEGVVMCGRDVRVRRVGQKDYNEERPHSSLGYKFRMSVLPRPLV
jgi:hypothetical protein